MRDVKESEPVGVKNPVFDDLTKVNRYLAKANAWMDDGIMDFEGDAMIDRGDDLIQSGMPGKKMYQEFIDSIVDRLGTRFALSDAEAISVIQTVAADLYSSGEISEMPDISDGIDDADYSLWVGQAQSIEFEGVVMLSVGISESGI